MQILMRQPRCAFFSARQAAPASGRRRKHNDVTKRIQEILPFVIQNTKTTVDVFRFLGERIHHRQDEIKVVKKVVEDAQPHVRITCPDNRLRPFVAVVEQIPVKNESKSDRDSGMHQRGQEHEVGNDSDRSDEGVH